MVSSPAPWSWGLGWSSSGKQLGCRWSTHVAEVASTSHGWSWAERRRTCWEEELLLTVLWDKGTIQGREGRNTETRHQGVSRRILKEAWREGQRRERGLGKHQGWLMSQLWRLRCVVPRFRHSSTTFQTNIWNLVFSRRIKANARSLRVSSVMYGYGNWIKYQDDRHEIYNIT